ncbi:MAG TPA: hypothetical protein DCS43_08175 [Verrucomicrobia bacterium]|nr:hypothetical protein [Verrucomicrobiota bacterium]
MDAKPGIEDLNGVRGKIFRVDMEQKKFELLKETVFDPKTQEGRSRHTVHWTEKTRFINVTIQNSFKGIDRPVTACFTKLEEGYSAAMVAGEPVVVMQVTIPAGGDDTEPFLSGTHPLVAPFVADPESEGHRGGTIELDGRRIPVRLRGPRSEVTLRTEASASDIGSGFWETQIKGRLEGGRFVADEMALYPLMDPRTVDDPALPRVLVIGDSISMNYHEPAKKALAGIANVHRIDGNGGPSDRGVACMELWLGDYTQPGLHWDLILFNHGLHDLKQTYDEATGAYGTHQVSINEFKANLEKEIAILRKTGAKLMWCSTSPVPNDSYGKWPEGTFGRRKDEDLVFNQAALDVMKNQPDIAVNDVNTFIRQSTAFDKWRQQKDVHFWNQAEQTVVGEFIAKGIEQALVRKVSE